jgi:hypothetical protein
VVGTSMDADYLHSPCRLEAAGSVSHSGPSGRRATQHLRCMLVGSGDRRADA